MRSCDFTKKGRGFSCFSYPDNFEEDSMEEAGPGCERERRRVKVSKVCVLIRCHGNADTSR